jgi:hypothetical protein
MTASNEKAPGSANATTGTKARQASLIGKFQPEPLAVELLVPSHTRRLTVDDHAAIVAGGFAPLADNLDALLVAPLDERQSEGQPAL